MLQTPAVKPKVIFVAASMLISAAAQAQPPGPETVKASNAYINCLIKAADKLDDGRSDAVGMGRSIQSVCLNEERRWEDAQTANYPGDKKRDFLEKIKTPTAAVAVRLVLENRRLKFGK
jgi:hypothetical protein